MMGSILQTATIYSRTDGTCQKGEVCREVPEGSPLSRTLFNILIDTRTVDPQERQSNSQIYNIAQIGTHRGELKMFTNDIESQAIDEITVLSLLDVCTNRSAKIKDDLEHCQMQSTLTGRKGAEIAHNLE